jgi:hypothetical protein
LKPIIKIILIEKRFSKKNILIEKTRFVCPVMTAPYGIIECIAITLLWRDS